MKAKHWRRRLITEPEAVESSHTFTGTDCVVLAGNTFESSLPVPLPWSDCAATWLQVDSVQCLDRGALTGRQVGQNMRCSGESSLRFPPLCDTLVIRYKSLLTDVQGRCVNSCLKQTHTSLSEWWQQHREMKGWERDWQQQIDRGRERRDGGGGDVEKTEKGKQFFCVSHHFTVVQFLLLSSTGNNHERGWLPGQLALLSLLHASKCRV